MLRVRFFRVWLVGLLLVCCGSVSAEIIFVDDDAAGGGDGGSWMTAFEHLQDALSLGASTPGSAIWVAAGTYRPDLGVGQSVDSRDSTFQLVNRRPVQFRPGSSQFCRVRDDSYRRDRLFRSSRQLLQCRNGKRRRLLGRPRWSYHYARTSGCRLKRSHAAKCRGRHVQRGRQPDCAQLSICRQSSPHRRRSYGQ